MTKLLSPYERYKRGIITRNEYLEQTGLIDSDYDKERKHLAKLARNAQFGWLVKYAQRLIPDEDWMIDDIIDMAYDCRQLKTDPGIPSLDFHNSYSSLLAYIDELKPPVPNQVASI